MTAASKFGSASEGARPLTGQNEPVGAPDSHAANRHELVEKIRSVFWQPLRIADHDAANAALDALAADTDELEAALAAMSKTVEQMTVHRDRSYRQGYDRGFRQAMGAARDGIDREMRLHESMAMECDG